MNTRVEVFCDFDGTVTVGDTVDIILEQLADEEWQNVENRWMRGEIGSRECMALQVKLICGGWKAILKVLDSIKIDPTFARFAQWCRQNAIPLNIVSDGIDKVIYHVLQREKILVNNIWANHLEEHVDGSLSLSFPYPPGIQSCSSGICKCKILSNAPHKPMKVVIGDGKSDFCWAASADMVFAKSKLLSHCRSSQLSCVEFSDFNLIRSELEGLIVPEFPTEPIFVSNLVTAI